MATLTRREALQMVGGAAAAAALRSNASAQAPAFPKGAVIRTLFKDYAPEELAGGATLFHEHLSLGADFGDRFRAAAAAVLAAQGAPPTARPTGPPPAPPGPDPMRDVDLMAEELRSAQRDGVACIVDAGLEGSGVDLEFIRAAAKKSGVPVVKGAGFYVEPFYPKEIASMSEEQLVRALRPPGRRLSRRRVRRDRIVGRNLGRRAQGVPRGRQSARRDESADLHAHGHPRKVGDRATRHPRGRGSRSRSASRSAISAI